MPEIIKGFVLRKFRGAPVKKVTLYVPAGNAEDDCVVGDFLLEYYSPGQSLPPPCH